MKKGLVLILTLVMCFAMTACGGAKIQVADATFETPAGCEFEVTTEEDGYIYAAHNYEGSETVLGVYSDTDAGASLYGFDPVAYTVEALYNSFVNDEAATERMPMKVDGVNGYVLEYNGNDKLAVFLHKDRFYLVEVWAEEGELSKQELADFDEILDSLEFK